jgi:hypothetical protein
VTVDNRNVPAIPIGLFQAVKIDKCGPFQESGPIGAYPVNPVEEAGSVIDVLTRTRQLYSAEGGSGTQLAASASTLTV